MTDATHTSDMVPQIDSLPESEQDQLVGILDEYLRSLERGMPVSPEELVEKHPRYASYLRGYLSGLNLFHQEVAGAATLKTKPTVRLGRILHTGERIGDFEIVGEIGRGGMGVVYDAVQSSLSRRVALKVLPFSSSHDEKHIARFQNEARAAAQLRHPNIVPVYAIGEDHGVHFYAMQLIEGQSLTTLLSELQTGATQVSGGAEAIYRSCRGSAGHGDISGPTLASTSATTAGPSGIQDQVRAVARLGCQAASALHTAHEYGIVHRDIKPSNLLLDDDGKLWVTDFGLARCREQTGVTQTGDILGTMRYMSPEQSAGRNGLVDHRTDIYSLGVTLYELATMHHPSGQQTDAQLMMNKDRFVSKPLRFWNRHIPVDFDTIITKAIAELPGERYATALEFAEDLQRFLEGQSILASPPSWVNRSHKWAARHRSLLYSTAGVALVLLVVLSVSMLLLSRKNLQLTTQKLETEGALVTARHNLQQAQKVLDRFATQLADQLEVIPGAEGVRYQLLEDSLGFYQDLASQAADEPALRADLALANSKLGTLSEKLGKQQDALKRHEAARKLWSAHLDKEPDNAECAVNLALCQNNIGLLLDQMGRMDDSLAVLAQAEGLLLQVADRKPSPPADVTSELAATYSNMGLVLQHLEKSEQARDNFDQAIALHQKTLVSSPENEEALRGLAVSYNNLGSLKDSANTSDVIACFEEAIRIQLRLVKGQPANRIYQGELARTYSNLGFTLAQQRDWPPAERAYLDAIRLQEHLVKASPLAASYRRDLAVSFNNLGMVQSKGRRYSEAAASFRRAIELQKLLLAAESENPQTLSNLGSVLNNLGLLYLEQQVFPDAEDAFRQAIKHQRKAFACVPQSAQHEQLLTDHYANYVNCLQNQDKSQAAEAVLAESRTALDPSDR